MRTHLLLILVLAILTTCGCSARRSWWPSSEDEYVVNYNGHEPAQWSGTEADFPSQAYDAPRRRPGRLAFLNPFNRLRGDQFEYEGEVIDQPCCSGCGAEGSFPGNGQCDNCLQETVSEVLQSQSDTDPAEPVQDPGVLTTPGDSIDPSVPVAPSMEFKKPSNKVVKPHAALQEHLPRVDEEAQWQTQQFNPVQPGLAENNSTRSKRIQREFDPTVPTTIVQDNRTNQNESSLPDWAGVGDQQKGPKPARIVNQFKDDIDWANLPKPKSIAMSADQRMGGEPSVETKSYGSKGRVIEFIKTPSRQQQEPIVIPTPDKPIEQPIVQQPQSGPSGLQQSPIQNNGKQSDPKFEQFTLDDLFPARREPQSDPNSQATPARTGDLQPNESSVVQQPSSGDAESVDRRTPTRSQDSARSIMDENIDWGMPNQGTSNEPTSSRRKSNNDASSQYSVVEEEEPVDTESGWGTDDTEDDESLYEDEHGEYEEDADFGSSTISDSHQDRFANRTEKDIIQELRNSTVPNRVVFDNSPQIPEQQPVVSKPLIMAARPVPHYQELRRLAKMNQEGAVDVSGDEMAIESLPQVGKTPAMTVSSQRVVEPTREFDFQPLPNLLLPSQIGLDDAGEAYWQDEAFDPDSILNNSPSTSDIPAKNLQRMLGDSGVAVQPVKSKAKKNAVPIILKAAPTFARGESETTSQSNSSSKAKIRFIKPSFQRELGNR